MHRPVCAHPFLPLLQARLRVTVNDPLGTVKTSGKEARLRLLFLISPSLSGCLAMAVYVSTQQFSLICVLVPLLLSQLGLLLPVLLQSWSVSGSTMVPWVLPVGLGYRQACHVFLLSLKPSWHLGTMFHLLTRLRVRKIMPINFIIELLDCSDQSQWFVGLDEEHCLLPVI